MASPGGSVKSASGRAPPKLPAVIANASLEDLQKLCLDTLKKLRARDKRIEELTASAAAVPDGSAPAAAELDALRQQVLIWFCMCVHSTR